MSQRTAKVATEGAKSPLASDEAEKNARSALLAADATRIVRAVISAIDEH